MNNNFIRIHNRIVRLDAISYIDFLESGRSMIFIGGLTPEKQHISVDVDETRRLLEFMEIRAHALSPAAPAPMADRDRARLEVRERRFA